MKITKTEIEIMQKKYPGRGKVLEERIFEYLKAHPNGLTQAEIKKGLNLCPTTVSKYLLSLEGKKKIKVEARAFRYYPVV